MKKCCDLDLTLTAIVLDLAIDWRELGQMRWRIRGVENRRHDLGNLPELP